MQGHQCCVPREVKEVRPIVAFDDKKKIQTDIIVKEINTQFYQLRHSTDNVIESHI